MLQITICKDSTKRIKEYQIIRLQILKARELRKQHGPGLLTQHGWNFWKSPKVPPAALPERPRQGILGFESSCLYPVTLQDAAGRGCEAVKLLL